MSVCQSSLKLVGFYIYVYIYIYIYVYMYFVYTFTESVEPQQSSEEGRNDMEHIWDRR